MRALILRARIQTWQSKKFFYNGRVIGVLRFLGLLNAAVWLGAAISFTFALGPAFFSSEMKALLPAFHNGVAAEIVIQRYFILLHCCGGIALLHLILEKLYLGKQFERLTLLTLALAISLALLGGFWLQPKLKQLHLKKYDARSSIALRSDAEQSFKIWHGVSQTLNLFMIGGLVVYFWRLSVSSNSSRFISKQKFRG